MASFTRNAEKSPAGDTRLAVVRSRQEYAMSEIMAMRMTERIARRKSSKRVSSRCRMEVSGKSPTGN